MALITSIGSKIRKRPSNASPAKASSNTIPEAAKPPYHQRASAAGGAGAPTCSPTRQLRQSLRSTASADRGVVCVAPLGHTASGTWIMLERVGDPAIDAIGSSPPGWWLAVLVAFAVAVCALAIMRGNFEPRVLALRAGIAVILAVAGWWLLDQLAGQDRAAERRALEWRSFELTSRALAPGSALACLDALAGEAIEDACEATLFASPEATAGAVAYVAAQLTFLAQARDRGDRSLNGAATAPVRRAIEADRYGIVAHVLATRDGCTPARCAAYFLLRDASQIRTNLAEHAFANRVKTHMASWPAAGSRPVAVAEPPAATASASAPAAASKAPSSNVYFPSSSSIPPVTIMSTEPPTPHERTGTTADAAPPSSRKPAGTAPARTPPAAGGTASRSAPMQLAPAAQ